MVSAVVPHSCLCGCSDLSLCPRFSKRSCSSLWRKAVNSLSLTDWLGDRRGQEVWSLGQDWWIFLTQLQVKKRRECKPREILVPPPRTQLPSHNLMFLAGEPLPTEQGEGRSRLQPPPALGTQISSRDCPGPPAPPCVSHSNHFYPAGSASRCT